MRRLAALTVLSLALATGCGGSDGPKQSLKTDPVDLLKAAASTTAAAGSSKIEITSTTKVQDQSFTFTGGGAFSFGEQPLGQLSMKGEVAGQDISIEMRVVDGTAYLQLPQQPGWYAAKLSDLAGTSFGSQADPAQSLQYLAGVSDDVKEVGTEQVRGEKTTHFTGTIDVKAMLAQLKGSVKANAEKAFSAGNITTLPYDAYVDSKGRMRKMVQKVTLEIQGQKGESTSTVEFFDFGTKVEVTPPPASEVKDGTALLKGFGG